MIGRIVAFLGVMVMLASTAGVKAAPVVTFETSPGGIAYVRVLVPGVDRVAIEAAWPTDWSMRSDANQRVPQVGCRAMLIGGADGISALEAAETLADLDAQTSLWADSDHVWGSLDVRKKNLDAASEIVNAFLRAPTFEEKWFARARDDIASSVGQGQASPAVQAFEAAGWAMMGRTPLQAFLSSGTVEQVEAVTREDVRNWYATVFTRTGLKIAIAGDIDANEAGKAIDAIVRGLPEGQRMRRNDVIPDMRPRRVLLHMPEAKTSFLAAVGRLPSIAQGVAPEDLFAVEALGGTGGVINQALRGQLGAVYAFGWAMPFYNRQSRAFMLFGEVETSKIAQAETTLLKSYSAFRQDAKPLALDALRNDLLNDLKSDGRNAARSADEALYAIISERSMDMLTAPDRFLQDVSADSIRHRLQENLPAAEELMIFSASPDANALPGACVISRPEDVLNCK